MGGACSMWGAVVAGVLPGLLPALPLRNFEEADYLSHEVPDISIPARALRALEQAGSRATGIGVEMAAELVAEVSQLVQGAVLALPADDPGALDVLPGALP